MTEVKLNQNRKPGPLDQIGELLETVRKVEMNSKIDLDGQQRCLYDSPIIAGREKGMSKFIAYYRVSTRKQGASGLGLDSQRADVARFIEATGGDLIAETQEVESGNHNDRPRLAEAMARARREKATLIVAKLDRLSRNVAFLSALMESGVDFVCVDNPHANRFTLHILASVAQWEREAISKRTKAALGAAKERGELLGSARPGHWAGREEARLKGAKKGAKRAGEVAARAAREAYADLAPKIKSLREQGLSLRAIAARLNEEGYKTRRGADWNPVQVAAVLKMD